MRRVATELDCGFLDLHAAFRARAGADYDELFVLDGHCNDRGYRLMGDLVAERLLEGR